MLIRIHRLIIKYFRRGSGCGRRFLTRSNMEVNQGFKIEQDATGRNVFFVDSSRLEESVDYIKETDITDIAINRFYGYSLNNLTFLEKLTDHLEGLVIVDDNYDLKPVNRLRKLK